MAALDGYAPDWTPEQREAWIVAELAGEPVIRPMLEHDPGACEHCDVLRELQREADERV
jgi:hypothetical protein